MEGLDLMHRGARGRAAAPEHEEAAAKRDDAGQPDGSVNSKPRIHTTSIGIDTRSLYATRARCDSGATGARITKRARFPAPLEDEAAEADP